MGLAGTGKGGQAGGQKWVLDTGMGIERDRHGEKGDKQVDRIRYKIQACEAGKGQGLGHAHEKIGYRQRSGHLSSRRAST